MPETAMHLAVEAEPDTVYTAISTTEGMRGWFTTTTATAAEGVDGLHEPAFPGVPEPWRLRVTEAGPERRLVLAGPNGPWTGTEQTHELPARPEGGITLRFPRSGFPAVDDVHRDFTYGGATTFVRLKSYAETGEPALLFTA